MDKVDAKILRRANRRIAAAVEWSKRAGLLNVAAELNESVKEISDVLNGTKR